MRAECFGTRTLAIDIGFDIKYTNTPGVDATKSEPPLIPAVGRGTTRPDRVRTHKIAPLMKTSLEINRMSLCPTETK
jgi:hypothetical protein